jgi:preprotein translocase subunit SecE
MSLQIRKIVNLPWAARNFVREAQGELKKVNWPTREVTLRYTLIVIASSLVVGLLIGGLDYFLTTLIEQIIANLT